jgi:hypothetical protein
MIAGFSHVQRDFSAGEVIEDAARRDDTNIVRAGCKKLLNWENLTAGGVNRRPGMWLKYTGSGTLFKIDAIGGVIFDFRFNAGSVTYYNNTTANTKTLGGCPWAADDLGKLTVAVHRDKVWVAVDRGDGINFRPQVLTYDDGTEAWTREDFVFLTNPSGQRRMPFYRYADKGVTAAIAGNKEAGGTVTITFSSDTALHSDMLNDYLMIGKAQVRIAEILSANSCRATVIQDLPPIWRVHVGSSKGFNVGDIVETETTGGKGQVIAVEPGTPDFLYVHLTDSVAVLGFDEDIIGPTARTPVGDQTAEEKGAKPILLWTEQFISDFRGWPGAVSHDRGRLIFSKLPGIKNAVLWSAVGEEKDFFIGANASDAMLERAPGNEEVHYVLGGPDQFVFTDKNVYYIPISAEAPLKPGAVEFRLIGSVGTAHIQPKQLLGGTFFIDGSGNRIMAVRQTGSQSAPYSITDTARYHSHLIDSPVALAVRDYGLNGKNPVVFAVNSDGTIVYGSYEQDKDWIGYSPWETNGTVLDVAADANEILFKVERFTDTSPLTAFEYLRLGVPMDGVVLSTDVTVSNDLFVNGTNLVVNGQTLVIEDVRFSAYANRTVDVWSEARYWGSFTIGSGGRLPAEALQDEMPTWVGLKYECVLIPFANNFDGGQAQGQRQRLRKINRYAVTVRRAQAFGINGREVNGYRIGDDMGLASPARDRTFRGRALGRSDDPQLLIAQRWPGRITVIEVAMEVTG